MQDSTKITRIGLGKCSKSNSRIGSGKRSKSKVFERIVEVAEKIRKEKGIGIKDRVEVGRGRAVSAFGRGGLRGRWAW